METLGNAFPAKTGKKFYCKFCDYGTSRKNRYDEHVTSAKHQKLEFGNILETEGNANHAKPKYSCANCSKEFKHRSGLWKHKKTCKVEDKSDSEPSDKDIIMMLIKENSEFKNMMMKVLENGTHNHTNSHNKSFNLQFFLNETCKNAMNITDFVDSLQLQLSDLEKVGEIGYIEGISSIIIKNLNALDVTLRPVHCTDKKRETMYIKNDPPLEKVEPN